MLKIAHRGNTRGICSRLENTLPYIDAALQHGYDAEVDLWLTPEGLRLGHDYPEHTVTAVWLAERAAHLWLHCKNLEALQWVLQRGYHGFFHQADAYTLTTQGWIWAYPGQPVGERVIAVVREGDGPVPPGAAGYCVDDMALLLNSAQTGESPTRQVAGPTNQR